MNKTELIKRIAIMSDAPVVTTRDVLDTFLGIVAEALSSGEKVSIASFGTFSVAKREARAGFNPKTGEHIEIAARKVVKFKPGKYLAEAVNKV